MCVTVMYIRILEFVLIDDAVKKTFNPLLCGDEQSEESSPIGRATACC